MQKSNEGSESDLQIYLGFTVISEGAYDGYRHFHARSHSA
jgi:hypothetical protein